MQIIDFRLIKSDFLERPVFVKCFMSKLLFDSHILSKQGCVQPCIRRGSRIDNASHRALLLSSAATPGIELVNISLLMTLGLLHT